MEKPEIVEVVKVSTILELMSAFLLGCIVGMIIMALILLCIGG
jgi:hypothetical protein